MGDRAWRVAIAALVLAGLVLRLVVLVGRWGAIDSDEAVTLLTNSIIAGASYRI